jgi:DNA-binding response OmpR family regulator
MDLSMPDVSGFAATEATRRIEAAVPDVVPAHIVALTGLVGERDRVAALEAGVDEYLVKPAKLADIRRVVEEWRRRRGRGVRGEGG